MLYNFILILENIPHKFFVKLQIGGATALIGDPSGKSTERPALPEEQVRANAQVITENIERIFRNHERYIWQKSKDAKALKPVKYCSYLPVSCRALCDTNTNFSGWLTMLTGTNTPVLFNS